MGFNFTIENVAQTVDFLDRFNKDVAKVLKKEIKSGANEVAKVSRSLIPHDGLRNWGQWTFSRDGRDLGFIGAFVKKGIATEQTRTRMSGVTVAFGYRVVSRTAAGAIYELAGSKNDKEGMGLAMGKKHPTNVYPRTLFPAYYAAMPKVLKKVEAAIEKSTRMGG